MNKTLLTLLSVFCITFLMHSQTTFKPRQNIDPNLGEEGYEIASGDLDGDGDIDIVIATYDFNGGTPNQDFIKWYSNDGDGNFTIEATVSSTIQWVDGLTVADIDGQFGDDIVATSVNQDKLVYFLSDGAGGFGSETLVATVDGPGEVIAADINMDGTIDLVTPVYNDNRTAWFSNDGTGTFTAETDIESGTTDGAYHIDVADYDGDTDLDVVVGFVNGSQPIEIYYNQYIESGSTSVSFIQDTVTVDSGGSTFLFNVDFADVDNDGQLDIIKVDFSGGVVRWFSKIKNGASTAADVCDSSIIGNPAKAFVADLDNDNIDDVIVTDGGVVDDAIIWFKGNSNAAPAATETTIENNNFIIYDIVVEDFDGDNDNDIATIGNASDTVDWFENEIIDLSLNDFNNNKIRLYPNPSSDLVNFEGLVEVTSLEVTDVLGQRVMTTQVSNQLPLDVSNLTAGMYFLKIANQNESIKLIRR